MTDDSDLQAVRELPTHFVSVSNLSPTIQKLLEQKKNDHEFLMLSLKELIQKINIKTEQDIQNKSDEFKKQLYEIKEDVKQQFIDIKFKLKHNEIEDNIWKKNLMNLDTFNKKALKAVHDYCKSLRKFEESRQDQFKNLLQQTKLNAVEIAHELPFMLDEFFECQIMEMNKITVNNYQHYADTEKELKLQVENDMKLWTEEYLEVKELIKERSRLTDRKSIGFAEEFMKERDSNPEFIAEKKRFNSLKSNFQITFVAEDGIVSIHELEKWVSEIQKCLGALDQSAKNIVQLYKSTITVLFHRYLADLDEIKNNIATGIVHSDQVDEYQCEIYTPSADQLAIQYMDELQQLQDVWGNAIDEMTDNINKTYSFLKGATCMWDRHFVRIKELQVLVLQDLENTIEKNISAYDCYEASLNILFEQLRQGSNPRELETLLENVKKLLDRIQQAYVLDADIEIGVVCKYKTYMETGIEVLTSELKQFLTFHPPDYEKDPKLQRKRASQMSTLVQGPCLPIQILYCVFQVGAVKNWMFGLWEAIDQYIAACKHEIMTQVDHWIDLQIVKIKERLKMKLTFHEPRFQQVKGNNYEKRLKELTLHANLLKSHQIAAEERIRELRLYNKVYEEKVENLISQYQEEAYKIIKGLPDTNSSTEAVYYSVVVIKNMVPIEKAIKTITDEYMGYCLKFFEELKMTSYLFLDSAKLFAEGGNFNMDEINTLYKSLNKIEEKSYKDVQNLIKEINDTFCRYTTRLEEIESSVTVTLNEVIDEHKHNENITKKLNKLEQDLHSHVKGLHKLFSSIENKLRYLGGEAKKNSGQKECLDSFFPKFQIFLDMVTEVAEYVYHPEPVDIFSLTGDKRSSGKRVSHLELLFNKHPEPEAKDFISTIVNFIYESFSDIKNSSKEFYNRDCYLILDPSKLKQTYDDCMDEVLKKYKPYLIQSELYWVENAVSFISILNSIKTFKEEFLLDFQTALHQVCLKKFELFTQKLFDGMGKEQKKLTERLQQIYKRLKILFGHPKNNEMLRDLQNDYEELHKDNENKFATLLEPRMEALEDVFNVSKLELEKIHDILPSFKEDNTVFELTEKLMLQITTKRQLLGVVICEIEDSDHLLIKKSVMEYIQNYFQSFTQETDLDVSDRSQIKATSLATMSTEETISSRVELLNTLEDYLNGAKIKLEEYFQEKFVNYLEDFKKSWASEITFILNLYKVRYDI